MKALLIVDMQNDFMPGGALGVPGADQLVPLINVLMKQFDYVIATQDWHPKDHMSFTINQGGAKEGEVIETAGIQQVLWPVHCVQNSSGAEVVTGLDVSKIDHVIRKGTDRWIDSYSTFFDNAHRKKTSLADYLFSKGVDTIYLVGVATDYCVYYSALDALDLGFKVFVIQDGCCGIDLHEGDIDKALQMLNEKGAQIVSSDTLE